MHVISSYRGNRPTNTHTQRQDRLQYGALQLARSVTTANVKLLEFTDIRFLMKLIKSANMDVIDNLYSP